MTYTLLLIYEGRITSMIGSMRLSASWEEYQLVKISTDNETTEAGHQVRGKVSGSSSDDELKTLHCCWYINILSIYVLKEDNDIFMIW
jgi:hypothetical protein